MWHVNKSSSPPSMPSFLMMSFLEKKMWVPEVKRVWKHCKLQYKTVMEGMKSSRDYFLSWIQSMARLISRQVGMVVMWLSRHKDNTFRTQFATFIPTISPFYSHSLTFHTITLPLHYHNRPSNVLCKYWSGGMESNYPNTRN